MSSIVNKKWIKFLLFTGLIFTALTFTSCGYYSFKGSLPSYIQSIAISLFDNQAPDPGVPEELNQLLRDMFIDDNTLKVVDESKADLLLTGTIQSIRVKPAVVRAGEQVTEDQLVVTVKAKCEDLKTGKALFNKPFDYSVPLDATAGLDERQQAISEALKYIAEDILNATLGAW
jgi:hypothetical protein